MEDRKNSWEYKQAELWDRIFQVTQDVVTLADDMDDDKSGAVVRTEMIKAAMFVGVSVVRANAAESEVEFDKRLTKARLKAIETDYWLRMAYVLQQRESIQKDLSGIITQYTAIVDMLQKFIRHSRMEKRISSRRATGGPRIN